MPPHYLQNKNLKLKKWVPYQPSLKATSSKPLGLLKLSKNGLFVFFGTDSQNWLTLFS
jgi:hypothetical protein